MRIILLGEPGAGKSIYSAEFTRQYGISRICRLFDTLEKMARV